MQESNFQLNSKKPNKSRSLLKVARNSLSTRITSHSRRSPRCWWKKNIFLTLLSPHSVLVELCTAFLSTASRCARRMLNVPTSTSLLLSRPSSAVFCPWWANLTWIRKSKKLRRHWSDTVSHLRSMIQVNQLVRDTREPTSVVYHSRWQLISTRSRTTPSPWEI